MSVKLVAKVRILEEINHVNGSERGVALVFKHGRITNRSMG